MIDFTVGTPAQTLSLAVDTASSNIWVNVADSELCRDGGCQIGGAFKPDSATKMPLVKDFHISYDDGFTISGEYITDTMIFDHKSVTSVPFGLGIKSDTDPGVFGIGYSANQAQSHNPGAPKRKYPTFSQVLMRNGIIKIEAFSMWLDGEDSGNILFGGVDRAKYHDKLKPLPVLPESDGTFLLFRIRLFKLRLSQGNSEQALSSVQESFPLSVYLDSGCNYIQLPPHITAAIHQALKAKTITGNNWPLVDCDLRKSPLTLDFTFDSMTIQVSMSSLIGPWEKPHRGEATTKLCELALTSTTGKDFVLGTPFLRSVYVVYNMQNNEVSLAQINLDATGSEIVEISQTKSSSPEISSNSVKFLGLTNSADSAIAMNPPESDDLSASATPSNTEDLFGDGSSKDFDALNPEVDGESMKPDDSTDASDNKISYASTDRNGLVYNNDFTTSKIKKRRNLIYTSSGHV